MHENPPFQLLGLAHDVLYRCDKAISCSGRLSRRPKTAPISLHVDAVALLVWAPRPQKLDHQGVMLELTGWPFQVCCKYVAKPYAIGAGARKRTLPEETATSATIAARLCPTRPILSNSQPSLLVIPSLLIGTTPSTGQITSCVY